MVICYGSPSKLVHHLPSLLWFLRAPFSQTPTIMSHKALLSGSVLSPKLSVHLYNMKRDPEGEMYGDMDVEPAESVWGGEEPTEERPGRSCPQWPKTNGPKIQAVDRSRTIQGLKPGNLGIVQAPYSNDITYTGGALSVSKPFLHTVSHLFFKPSLCELSRTIIK